MLFGMDVVTVVGFITIAVFAIRAIQMLAIRIGQFLCTHNVESGRPWHMSEGSPFGTCGFCDAKVYGTTYEFCPPSKVMGPNRIRIISILTGIHPVKDCT